MKKISILLAIALMAIIYSCGNGGNNGNTKTVSNESKQESQTKIDNKETQTNNIDTERLKDLLKKTPKKDIYIVKYKGTLGKSHITLELKNLDDDENSLYMYDNINNPLVLKYDKTKNYICLDELFPKKGKKNKKDESDEKKYKKGGTLSFKNSKNLAFELTGEYKNPKGTKTYPVNLQAVEVYTKNQKENFEELQEYRTNKHYFTLVSSWFEDDFYSKILREVKQINVYDKKTNKMLQSLPIPFGKVYCFAVIEPTNTKPNGIQIGCSPKSIINPGYFDDYVAFIIKNGKYVKDSLVCGHEEYERGLVYRKYNENGDVLELSSYSERDFYKNIIYVTSENGFSESISEDLPNDRSIIYRNYDTYSEEITVIPFDYDFNSDKKPVYMETIRTDKKTGKTTRYVETNYPKDVYKISDDGKTLLKWNEISGIVMDLNGQDDLRKIEKIDKNAFAECHYGGDMSEVDFSIHGNQLFAIILNSNFKSIPPEIKKYENLEGRIQLVTSKEKKN